MNTTINIPEFIDKVRSLHSRHSTIRSNISLDDLIESLNELNDLIEIYSVKEAIITQIEMLLVLIIKNDFSAFNKDMLHTVFYGSPGVGKSRTAYILAKIWRSLGILKRSPVGNFLSNPRKHFEKISQLREDFVALYDNYLTPEKKDCKSMMDKYQKDWLSIYNRLIGMDSRLNSQEDNIVICSREDFVAEYAGQTSIKTANFLNKCLGKCIIIEEAYTLHMGETDGYGLEAITVLNRFMDEHCDELIVIFTGYENKLRDSIFKAQPGLERRCQWFFHLQSYSAEGLAKIFTKQLKDMDWYVKDRDFLIDFFKKNISSFRNYGGDTIKLAFKCKLYHSKKIFDKLYTDETKDIDYILDNPVIEKAFEEYCKHIKLI
jgi:hypothetical protein